MSLRTPSDYGFITSALSLTVKSSSLCYKLESAVYVTAVWQAQVNTVLGLEF